MGKIFNKGLDKDDQKEGLFKRLKYIENAQKKLTSSNNNNDDYDDEARGKRFDRWNRRGKW